MSKKIDYLAMYKVTRLKLKGNDPIRGNVGIMKDSSNEK